MNKRIIMLVWALVLVFAMSACATDGESTDKGNKKDVEEKQSEVGGQSFDDEGAGSQMVDDSWEDLLFMGHNVFYPADTELVSSDYGEIVAHDEFCILIESPAVVGEMLNTTNLNEAVTLCEEYVYETFEHKLQSLFDLGKTEQTITKTQEVTYNGVKMLLVEGTFTNTKAGSVIPFSAIYLLAGEDNDMPVYIVGVPRVEGKDIGTIVKEMAKKNSK